MLNEGDYPHDDHVHLATPSPQPCGALLPPLRDYGWKCNGTGLIVVLTWKRGMGRADVPVVLPRRALEIIEPESWWETPVRDFLGGDHVHLCVPRRPTTFHGDTPVLIGDQVVSYQRIGTTSNDGGFFIGPSDE